MAAVRLPLRLHQIIQWGEKEFSSDGANVRPTQCCSRIEPRCDVL